MSVHLKEVISSGINHRRTGISSIYETMTTENDVPTKRSTGHPLEITISEDSSTTPTDINVDVAVAMDAGGNEDMEALLSNADENVLERTADEILCRNSNAERMMGQNPFSTRVLCFHPSKVGNCTVLLPNMYAKTGMGVVGPHWSGLLCTFVLLSCGCTYFVHKAVTIGPITSIISAMIATTCFGALFRVGFFDPGVITWEEQAKSGGKSYAVLPKNRSDFVGWKWCDVCG